METNRNRRKHEKYMKWMSYGLAFLFMVAIRYMTDKPADVHNYQGSVAVVVADNYFMPGNEVCTKLIAELKNCRPDFQVHHLVD